jgi:diketogulonate reductase-like aldo/keto reductase
MQTVTLSTGEIVPALGLGTWHMGERRGARSKEVKALQLGLDLGLALVDTAEMYGDGGAEEIVAEATAGRRDSVYIVSKVYPHNASRQGAIAACERSLNRLRTDRIDLYLLHWRGSVALAETVKAFETLKSAGKIRAWGVSNFDSDDMKELSGVAAGRNCVANQVLYHLGSRGIEWDLLTMCQKQKITVMAYSPLGQGSILNKTAVKVIAKKHDTDPAAIGLAWVLRQSGVVAIPKASNLEHVRANAAALDVKLDSSDLAALEQAFPPPNKATSLRII